MTETEPDCNMRVAGFTTRMYQGEPVVASSCVGDRSTCEISRCGDVVSGVLAYYAAMWRNPRIIRFLLWTIVLAVVTVKASGAHVHLCMDGQEPPASVHFADIHDDEHHQQEGQADKDVNPLFGALVKKGGPDFDFGLAITVAVLSWVLPVAGHGPFPPELQSIPRDHSFYWRPPLRGPPA